MKKFIRFLLGLFALVFVLLVLLDYTYTTVYQHSTPRNKFQYLFQLKPQKIDYVFLGSSRVENSIIPNEIEKKTNKKAMNLGFQAAKMQDIFTLLQSVVHQACLLLEVHESNAFNVNKFKKKSNFLFF